MANTNLFLFPHAGGAPTYYAPLAKEISPNVKRIAVPYPGRGGTHDVSAFDGVEQLADVLWRKLSPATVKGEVAFFGHSLGALVAFEMAQRFEAAGHPVRALFVSASAAPGNHGFDEVAGSDDALLAAASSMTGIDQSLLAHEEFSARILPTLRGFRAITRYRPSADTVLISPIRAFYGTDDVIATVDRIEPWSTRTTGQFTSRAFTGHHFYLDDHLPGLAREINETLAEPKE